MTRRSTIFWSVAMVAVLCCLPCGVLRHLLPVHTDRGSPVVAAAWSDELNLYVTPDAARDTDSEIIVLRCKNGEWAFGKSADSHGFMVSGGGTIVVRDSTGQTRVFFGHVCGSNYLLDFERRKSLAEIYKEIEMRGFKEYFPE
jgi:hypothetical protein